MCQCPEVCRCPSPLSAGCSPVEVYFATASMDRTARLWSCDSVYPIRVFAGHNSAVDVRELSFWESLCLLTHCPTPCPALRWSSFTPTATTSPQAAVTERVGCGMCRAGIVCASSLAPRCGGQGGEQMCVEQGWGANVCEAGVGNQSGWGRGGDYLLGLSAGSHCSHGLPPAFC